MADTADRRSEGKGTSRHYRARKALGVCVVCGVNPVSNRVWCYSCVDKQITATSLTGYRRIFKDKMAERAFSVSLLQESLTHSNLHPSTKEFLILMLELVKPRLRGPGRIKRPPRIPKIVKPKVVRVIGQLTELQQRCYDLRMQGTSPSIISHIVGITAKKVVRVIRDARAKIRVKSPLPRISSNLQKQCYEMRLKGIPPRKISDTFGGLDVEKIYRMIHHERKIRAEQNLKV